MQDLRTLAIFVKVAERLSFVRAAADLGITQAGVSNAISRLEDQVGARLLARTTRRVTLTEHGAAYFQRCRQALAELAEAELELKDAQVKPSGNLRIDMPVSFGRLKVVPLLGAFRAQFPDVKLRVTFNDRYIDLIEEGVDVSIRFGALQDSSLVVRRLAEAQLSVVASPHYFSKYGRPLRPEDLAEHDCIAFTFRESRMARDWRFARAGTETALTPQGTMSFSDGAAVLDAVCAGYGIAQLQDFFTDAPSARGRLVEVLEKFRPSPQPIWLVYPQTRHVTPQVRAFLDFMVAQFHQQRTELSRISRRKPRRS
jgi:DNA-binding transcriptional LysR family regulator